MKKTIFTIVLLALALSAFGPPASPPVGEYTDIPPFAGRAPENGGRVRSYVGVFVRDGKMAFGDGSEAVVPEGTVLYHFAWRPNNMRYGCLAWRMSPAVCGVTRAENVRKIEP